GDAQAPPRRGYPAVARGCGAAEGSARGDAPAPGQPAGGAARGAASSGGATVADPGDRPGAGAHGSGDQQPAGARPGGDLPAGAALLRTLTAPAVGAGTRQILRKADPMNEPNEYQRVIQILRRARPSEDGA